MASRGQHVAGTDGKDFAFRERVEPKYAIIAELRKTLRFYIKLSVGWTVARQMAAPPPQWCMNNA